MGEMHVRVDAECRMHARADVVNDAFVGSLDVKMEPICNVNV